MKRFLALILVGMLLPALAVAESFQRGDECAAVATFQRQLYQLGYLDGTVDGEFGSKTEKSVKAFQRAFGLSATGVLDPDTQWELTKLYGTCTDSEMQVVHGFCQWRERGGDRLEFRTQVTNVNPDDDYATIEMAYYCEDRYGNRVFPAEGYYWCTQTTMKMPYGERKYTAYTTLENRSSIANVYVAVKTVENQYGLGYATPVEELHFVCFPIS